MTGYGSRAINTEKILEMHAASGLFTQKFVLWRAPTH